jgi:hypothetical protein
VSDFTTIGMEYNTGTDASPTYGTALALSGTSGANELRMALSTGGATGSTASGAWPFMAKPVSGTAVVDQLWAFTANTTGSQIATYDGTNTKARVLRWSFDNLGTPVTAMQVTAYGNSTHTAPSPGTQPPGTNNDAFTNGQSTDTSSKSYVKINMYGSGLTAAAAQETPSAGTVGTLPTATTGTAGSVSPGAGAWLSAWQAAQGAVAYVTGPAIPAAVTAFKWYMHTLIFLGSNITAGSWVFNYTLIYSFA